MTPGGALEQQIRVVPLLHLSALHLSDRRARKKDKQAGRRACGLLQRQADDDVRLSLCAAEEREEDRQGSRELEQV